MLSRSLVRALCHLCVHIRRPVAPAGAALQLQIRCSRGLPRPEEGISMQFDQEGAPATLGKGSMAGKGSDEEHDEEEEEDDDEEEEHEQERDDNK